MFPKYIEINEEDIEFRDPKINNDNFKCFKAKIKHLNEWVEIWEFLPNFKKNPEKILKKLIQIDFPLIHNVIGIVKSIFFLVTIFILQYYEFINFESF